MVDVMKTPCSVTKMLATTTTTISLSLSLSLSLSNFSNQHEEPCAFVGMSWFHVGVENEEHMF